MVDTEPLRGFLAGALGVEGTADASRIPCIADNLARGALDAVAITSTSYATGQSITWVEGRDVTPWERPLRRCLLTELGVEHVMASAALPLLFPAVKVAGEWHGDGGIRQMAPLSPALHLGGSRILAIATRRSPLPRQALPDRMAEYPPPAQIMGVLANAVFLDALDYDAMMMERMNELARAIGPEGRRDIREIDLLVVRPSADLGLMAAEHETELPRLLRFLLRGWGTKEVRAPDSLAMLMFESGYITRLIELGERDADARAGDLERFIERAERAGALQT
jgi:NTE family protein